MLPLVHVLNKWEFHILVVLSFTLQVFLLLFGGIRRRNDSVVARIFLWLVYLSADSTATYTLGHMASSGRISDAQPLVVFWAPFLLLHLGGQDTVTAYAIEDNELWLRHLFILVVQAFGAAYILYKYLSAGDRFLIPASILVFVVGVVKYGERIWALKCASMSSMQEQPFIVSSAEVTRNLRNLARDYEDGQTLDDYRIITDTAHLALQSSKRLFVTPSISSEWRCPRDYLIRGFGPSGQLSNSIVGSTRSYYPWAALKFVYRTVDLELSLIYDLLYTKSAVIHTWYGYIIRAWSFLAIVSALVLFIMSTHSRYSRSDVAVTYVLLVGASVLEIISIVRVIGSTWTYAYLRNWHLRMLPRSSEISPTTSSNKMRRFAGAVLSLRWHLRVRLGVWFTSLCRRTSPDMHTCYATRVAQYEILSTAASRPLEDIRWKIAKLLGQEDRWINAHHSTFIQVPEAVVEAIYTEVKRRAELNREDAIILDNDIRLGRWTRGHYEKLESLSMHIHERGLTWFILVCHIATDIFLYWCDKNGKSEAAGDLPQIARVLSNYIMYLLRVHQDVLPTVTTQHTDSWDKENIDKTFIAALPTLTSYIEMMTGRVLVETEQKPQETLLAVGNAIRHANIFQGYETVRWDDGNCSVFMWGSILGEQLLQSCDTEIDLLGQLQFVVDLWVDTLLYVIDGLTANFHAKQLSYGGEFLTFLSVLIANVGLHKEFGIFGV